MAKFLCVNAITYREGLNNIGDIVGVFNDDHPFTPREKEAFDIIDMAGTREEVETSLPKFEIKEVVKIIDKINDYQEFGYEDVKRVWNNSGIWQELVKDPKYKHILQNNIPILKVLTMPENLSTIITFKTKEQIAEENKIII